MGAWGTGIFENDSAADFLWEYEDAGVGAIVQAFDMVREGKAAGYIEADAASRGLAAAETVAVSHGLTSGSLDEEDLNSMKVHELDVRALVKGPEMALATVGEVTSSGGKSELYDLWSESDDLASWLSSVSNLRTRLEGIAQ